MAKQQSARSPQKTPGLADQLDRQLANSAYRKVMAGEQPTAQERAALKRYPTLRTGLKRGAILCLSGIGNFVRGA